MSNTGHKQTRIGGRSLADHLRPTIRQESQLFNVPMPTDEQIALVASALRMHTTMVHAASYDRSELFPREDQVTEFYPIESSIGRWLRDAAREVLDESGSQTTRQSNEEVING